MSSFREIQLNGEKAAGRVALVDESDFKLVMGYQWHVQEDYRQGPGGTITHYGPYASSHPHRNVCIRMHNLVTGWVMVDHINHDGLDNRKENLRETNPSLNHANMLPRTGVASRYKGVGPFGSKWRARICINGKLKHLGLFSSEEEAACAYDAAAKEAWGDHAYLNFPPRSPHDWLF